MRLCKAEEWDDSYYFEYCSIEDAAACKFPDYPEGRTCVHQGFNMDKKDFTVDQARTEAKKRAESFYARRPKKIDLEPQ